jgi:hypothetical protein
MNKHILYEFLDFRTGCVPYSVMPGNRSWTTETVSLEMIHPGGLKHVGAEQNEVLTNFVP